MTRKTFFAVSMVALIVAGLTSCKYEEGPFLSLNSPEARLSRSWEVVSVTDSAGDDETEKWDEAEFIFKEDKSAEATLEVLEIPLPFAGTSDLDRDDTIFELELRQTTTSITANYEFEILRLTTSEFWLRTTDDSTLIKLEVD